MDYETIQLEIANGAARLTLNRPDRLNSFTVQMHDEVSRGLEAVAKSGARVLVLIPDHTRSLPLPMLFRQIVEILHDAYAMEIVQFWRSILF